MKSVGAHLPAFAGNTTWNEEGMAPRLCDVIQPLSGFRASPPTWRAFRETLRSPSGKAPGPDGVAPHPLPWLLSTLQWDLYTAVLHVWHTQDTPHEWLTTRISMIHKKGDARKATNYRPISVSWATYVVLAHLIFQAVGEPISCALSEAQAGSQKHRTPS